MSNGKKKLLFGVAGLVLIGILVALYVLFLSSPKPFPDREKLVDEINRVYRDGAVQDIQDVIYLDHKNVYVPFVSASDEYSMSVWEWKYNKWKLIYMTTEGMPILWLLDRNAPSAHRILWNLHPDDGVDALHLYLINNRGYQISHRSNQVYDSIYTPKVQVDHRISLQQSSYGAMALPDEWITINKELEQLKKVNQSYMLPMQSVTSNIRVNTYDKDNQEVYPKRSVNGRSYSNGRLHYQFIMFINENDIEMMQ